MRSITISLLIAFVALIGGQEVCASEENAVEFVSSYGLPMRFPYFEDFREMNPRLKEVVIPEISGILAFLSETTSSTLDHHGQRSLMSWVKVGWDLYHLGQVYAHKRKKLGMESGTSPEFNVQLKEMFKRIMHESHLLEKQLKHNNEPKQYEELEVRSRAVLHSIIEAIQASPVAIYFDWRAGKIDGKSAEEALIDMFGRLRYHGFHGAIGAIEKLVNFIFWKSSKGWK